MIIYKTTNKINGKIYVGKDARNNPEYLGSGVLLEKAIAKYGRENFEKTTVEICTSLSHLDEREVYWVKELNATDRHIGYNIALGGTGGDTTTNLSAEGKKRMLATRVESLRRTFSSSEYRKRRSEITKEIWARPGYSDHIRQKMLGRKITWNTKLSENRCSVYSEERNKKISEAVRGRELTKVPEELENKIVEMYQEVGPRTMSERLTQQGHAVSQYLIIRVLKKRGIYQKWKKGITKKA